MIISKSRQRMGYLAAFVILFLIEAAIALWVHDRFIRPYIGDVLVVVLVYVFVRIFFPSGARHLVLYVPVCRLRGGAAVFPPGGVIRASGVQGGQNHTWVGI